MKESSGYMKKVAKYIYAKNGLLTNTRGVQGSSYAGIKYAEKTPSI